MKGRVPLDPFYCPRDCTPSGSVPLVGASSADCNLAQASLIGSFSWYLVSHLAEKVDEVA